MDIDQKVQMILRQTTYTEEEIRNKLTEYNNDEVMVIKDYLGVPLNVQNVQKPIKSVNQEIYKQIRTRLDSNMREYEERKLQE